MRDTAGTDDNNPFSFEYIRGRIEHSLREHEGCYVVVQVLNITNIFYGRDVGYAVERIDLDADIQDVSATKVRNALRSGGGRDAMRVRTSAHAAFIRIS